LTDHAHRKGLEIAFERTVDAFAGLYFKACAMQRTFNNVVLQVAVVEITVGVRTDVVGGVGLAADIIDGDVERSDRHADDGIRRQCRRCGDGDPALRHCAHRVSASRPACATMLSSGDLAPETPMAPIYWPSTTTGIPPSTVVTPGNVITT